jgi:hypothetical protein
LFLDDIEIVNKPFRCRRNSLLSRNCLCCGAVVLDKDAAVLDHSWKKGQTFVGSVGNCLGRRQRLSMFLEALQAKELGPNWFFDFRGSYEGLRRGHYVVFALLHYLIPTGRSQNEFSLVGPERN